LTENPNFSVLVLEAGVSNEGVLDSTVPFLVNDLLAPNIYDWSTYTALKPGAGRTLNFDDRLHDNPAARLEWSSYSLP
jgi:hypothetical protein